MAGRETAVLYHSPDRLCQVQKAQGVGNSAAALAHPLSGLFLGHVVVFHERMESCRFFHGIQVLPLEVFDHGKLCGFAVIGFDDDGGNFAEACNAGSPPAALTGNDLVVSGRELADR